MKAKPALLGKTLDLSKSYKEVAVRPSSLGVLAHDSRWNMYISDALTFGASASVFSFNEIALALLRRMLIKFFALGTDFHDGLCLGREEVRALRTHCRVFGCCHGVI